MSRSNEKYGVNELIVRAIVCETIVKLPRDLAKFYADVPGRMPNTRSLDISKSFSKLNESESEVLIAGIVDSAVSAVLNLIDLDFKELQISLKPAESSEASNRSLFEIYRSIVDPEGALMEKL